MLKACMKPKKGLNGNEIKLIQKISNKLEDLKLSDKTEIQKKPRIHL
jgi:hypothetical protein